MTFLDQQVDARSIGDRSLVDFLLRVQYGGVLIYVYPLFATVLYNGYHLYAANDSDMAQNKQLRNKNKERVTMELWNHRCGPIWVENFVTSISFSGFYDMQYF